MEPIYVRCCGKPHEIIQFTTKGPIQYGVECSKCGKRVAGETPEAVREGWKTEDDAFEMFASIHPHEAHAKWPQRFWRYFQKRCPDVPKSEMEKMLNVRNPHEPQTT